jgi:hypothetical protein
MRLITTVCIEPPAPESDGERMSEQQWNYTGKHMCIMHVFGLSFLAMYLRIAG